MISFLFSFISAAHNPLSVLLGLLGMKSMPKIARGKIIAGDSTNVQVTLLKKLPHLKKKSESPYAIAIANNDPNHDGKIPPFPDYAPYDDYHPEFDKIPDYDENDIVSY